MQILRAALIGAMIFVAHHAGAQMQPMPPKPVKQPDVYRFTVSIDITPADMPLLDRAIDELPKRIADRLIPQFFEQVQQQKKLANPAPDGGEGGGSNEK